MFNVHKPACQQAGGSYEIIAVVLAPALTSFSKTASSDEIKVGLREFPAGRGNPYQGCACSPAIFVWAAMYEQLVRVGTDGRPIPVR